MAGARSRHEIPLIKVHHVPPAIAKPSRQRAQRRLATFDAALLAAEPQPLPPTAAVYASDAAAARTVSVSELEQIAARLFPELRGEHGSGESTESAAALGQLVHAVMERVDFARDDWTPVIDAALRSLSTALDESQIQLAREVVRRLQQSEWTLPLRLARHVWREFDVLLPWSLPGSVAEPDLITGQVDCCYVSAEGTMHLVDYKTGDYSQARSDEAILAPYRLQLGLYALAAEQWWGRPPETVELVLCRPQVRRIACPVDAAARRQLCGWVDHALEELHRTGGLRAGCEPAER
jgi:ATP-dependent exoDNAse (exonuclease V) beta subunit